MKLFSVRRITAHDVPYLTRIKLFPRTFLHIFTGGDADPDPHDHPWDFWTFPLVPYAEQVVIPGSPATVEIRVVKAFRLHKRPAEHVHRIMFPVADGDALFPPHIKETLPLSTRIMWKLFGDGTIVTLVVIGKVRRSWGFYRRSTLGNRSKWFYVPWKRYVSTPLNELNRIFPE